MVSASRVVVNGCALFCYLLQFVVLVFYLFVLCSSLLSTLALVPALYSTTECGVSQLCTWYFYHAVVLGYDIPLPIFLF